MPCSELFPLPADKSHFCHQYFSIFKYVSVSDLKSTCSPSLFRNARLSRQQNNLGSEQINTNALIIIPHIINGS